MKKLARQIVRDNYSELLVSTPDVAPNQLEHYENIMKNINTLLKDGEFLCRGVDAQVNSHFSWFLYSFSILL